MRIAIVVRILWSAGTQKFAIEQAKYLAEAGHEVQIIFLRKAKSGDVYNDLLQGLKYKVLTDKNNSIFVPIYDLLTGIFMHDRKGEGRVDYNLISKFPRFAGNNFDLIICQDQWAGLAGYYTWKRYGIPYYVIIHEMVNDLPLVRGVKRILVKFALHYQKIILLKAEKIFSLTQKVAETVVSFYSKYGLECIVNFPGLVNRGFVDYKEKTDTIALVSYWNEVKFPEMYIDVFERLKGYDFLMIGNWISESYREYFISKLKERGVLERVSFLSNLDEDKKNLIVSFRFVTTQ
jgi:glycosyltransferase involved in cell wall biosynthesis